MSYIKITVAVVIILLVVAAVIYTYKKFDTKKTFGTKDILPGQHLPLQGGFNFRDMGGIKTKDGRTIKSGKIIRADELHSLTEKDLKYLASLPLVTIVDFRSEEEIAAAPDKNPSTVKNNYKISINPGNVVSADVSSLETITQKEAEAFMKNIYIAFVTDPQTIGQFKEFFRLLQNPENLSLLFHCTAGKDRTGTAAALFLYSLGVDEETIMKDYSISNIYLEPKYAKLKKMNPALRQFFEVQPAYLNEALDIVKKEYGSVEKYLTDRLDVDLDKMKEIYLD